LVLLIALTVSSVKPWLVLTIERFGIEKPKRSA
jgi:hypothetical protein